jgi:hypothetical protein
VQSSALLHMVYQSMTLQKTTSGGQTDFFFPTQQKAGHIGPTPSNFGVFHSLRKCEERRRRTVGRCFSITVLAHACGLIAFELSGLWNHSQLHDGFWKKEAYKL